MAIVTNTPPMVGRYCGQLPAFLANTCRIDEMVGDSNVAVGGADVIRSSYCAKTRSFGANATRLAMITVAATPPSTFLRRSVTTESSSATHTSASSCGFSNVAAMHAPAATSLRRERHCTNPTSPASITVLTCPMFIALSAGPHASATQHARIV